MRNAMTMLLAGLLFASMSVTTGCGTLNGTIPFRYVPSLPSAKPDKTVNLGVEKLLDNRPKDDKEATDAITDVDEKVTAKLIEDFRSSQIFASVDFPVEKKDDLVLKGEIKRFYWKLSPSPIIFIPLLNLLMYFGIDIYNIESVAEFHIQLINPKTGQSLAEYNKSSTKAQSYTLYNFKAGEAGAELAEAFREVSKQIKDAIISDLRSDRLKVAQN